MGEALDFGRYAPFVAAAYAASFLVLGLLIAGRLNRLKRALAAEREDDADFAGSPDGSGSPGGPDGGEEGPGRAGSKDDGAEDEKGDEKRTGDATPA